MCVVKDWLYMIWDLWHPCKHGDYIRDSNFVVFVIYSYQFSSTVNLRLHGFIFWEILGLENGVRFHGSHFGPPHSQNKSDRISKTICQFGLKLHVCSF